MRTGTLSLVEFPSGREQHPTNLLPLPKRLPAGASATQPTTKILTIGMELMEGLATTDLLLVCDDSRLQGLERALDDRSPDILPCDLLRLKGLYEF